MKIVRIYTGRDGKSHFEDVEIPLVEKEPADLRSKFTRATGIIFRETSAQYDLDYHVAPQRQYWISFASAIRRLVSPLIAETTTTSWCPARCHFSRRRA